MGKFKVNVFDCFNPEHQQKTIELLTQLNTSLTDIGSSTIASSSDFDTYQWQIKYYPEVWSKTDRSGASKLVIDTSSDIDTPPLLSNKKPFAVKVIISDLEAEKRKYKYKIFNKNARIAKKNIDITIKLLKNNLKQESLNFLFNFISQTKADLISSSGDLITSIKKLSRENPIASKNFKDAKLGLESQIGAIDSELRYYLHIPDNQLKNLKTANDSLNLTEAIHVATHELINYVNDILTTTQQLKKSGCSNVDEAKATEILHSCNEIITRANQLNILNKRFADPFYTNPLEQTKSEKYRAMFYGRRYLVLTLLLGLATLIAFFVAPHVVITVLTIIGAVAAAPVIIDKLFEFYRNFRHRRTPTNSQVASLIVAALAASAYLIIGHLTQVARVIGHVSIKLKHVVDSAMSTLGKVSDFVNNKINKASKIKGVFDYLASFFEAQPLVISNITYVAGTHVADTIIMPKPSLTTKSAATEPSLSGLENSKPGLMFFTPFIPSKQELEDDVFSISDLLSEESSEVDDLARDIIKKWNNINQSNNNDDLEKFVADNHKLIDDLIVALSSNNCFTNNGKYKSIVFEGSHARHLNLAGIFKIRDSDSYQAVLKNPSNPPIYNQNNKPCLG